MIRHAEPTDAADIENLIQQGIQGTAAKAISWWVERMASPNSLILLVFFKEKAVGTIVGQVVLDEAEIHDVVVESSFRQAGRGSELVTAFEEHAAHLGATHCFLEVRESNKNAKYLYAKHGFNTTSIRRDYYSDGEDALLMRKQLRALP